MSLEAALAANTAALEANTAALTGGKAPAKAAGSKPAGRAAKKADITVDVVAEKFGDFLNTGSAAAKKKAKLVVKGIVTHFEVERITKLDAEDFPKAMELLGQYQEGEDPLELFDEENEDDDGGMV